MKGATTPLTATVTLAFGLLLLTELPGLAAPKVKIAADLECVGCVDSVDIQDNTVGAGDLNFDPTTQAEHDTHAIDPSAHHVPTVNTNAGSICESGEYLDGDGTCKSASAFSVDTLLDLIDDLQTQIDLLHPKRLVFVTQESFIGEALEGALGGDTQCQILADEGDLHGTFMAWLSDSTTSPNDRFYKSALPYRLVDGTLVALNYDDLTDGTLANGIIRDQFGIEVLSGTGSAWTATDTTGNHSGEQDADDWGNEIGGSDSNGETGFIGAVDGTWTDGLLKGKGTSHRLYCFQQ